MHDFLNIIYRNSLILTISKPKRVPRKTATAIYHILTNSFIDRSFKTTIFKSDISDYFTICFTAPTTKPKIEDKTFFIFKIIHKAEPINTFKQKLYEANWSDIETYLNPNEAYKALLQMLLVLYDKYFPLSLKCEISTIWLVEIAYIFLIFLMQNARKLGWIHKTFEFIIT